MYTGRVTDIGEVKSVVKAANYVFEIFTSFDAADIEIGSFIACSGVDLTVVRHGISEGRNWFTINVSAETMSRTSMPNWVVGTKVNLEHSLRVGDEMGGHIVTGHVDATIEVVGVENIGDFVEFTFRVPRNLMPYIAVKGAIAIDGVSLTVDKVEGDTFAININPHTFRTSTFGVMAVGYKANLEVDIIARYVARMLGK